MQRIYRGRKLWVLVMAVFGLLSVTGAAARLEATGAGTVGPPPASIGDQMARALPADLRDAGFLDQSGDHVTLGDFTGRAVMLVPFLTSCQEECPITTGALEEIRRDVVADHLGAKVTIVEVTVDPARDSPERMATYAKLTGTSWPLLTASPVTIAALWQFFGIYYQEVPEGSPPGIDWQTHQPYTYDVDHSDGFVLLNTHLDERFVAAGMVRGAKVSSALSKLLDASGVHDLDHPGGGSWTVDQALDALGWVLGQNVAAPRPGA